MLTRAPAGGRVVRTGTLRFVGLAAVTAVVAGGCTGSGPGSPPDSPPGGAAAAALVAFDSCAGALRELTRAATPFVGPYGLALQGSHPQADVAASAREDSAATGAGAPTAPATPRHSTTNTHEAGVDEPDLVKTDGRRLVTVVGGRLRVVELASRRVTASLGLPDGPAEHLLLHGDRALVVIPRGGDQWRYGPSPVRPDGARLVLVDLTGAGRVLDTLTVDGSYVDARQVGGVARVVVRSGPRLRFVHPDGGRPSSAAYQQNLRVVAESSIDDWLPRYELQRAGELRQGRLVDCEQVSRPATYSASSMLTVLTLDLGGQLGIGDPVTVVADGDTVYGTASSLYVAAHQRFAGPQPRGGQEPGWDPAPLPRNQPQRTDVHKFDTSGPGRPRYVASGSVPGSLLNQYSLSEHEGRLRVATTLDPGTARCCDQQSRSESAVSVLTQRANRLVQVGRVDGLGKGERIYAVRFIGPVGYVVTFRQTDPLYTLDLSDPTRPRVVGELKITGYSAYLHPTGEGSLLGVGQEATGQGVRLGTQVSLFDVGDPARPRRIAQHHLRYGESEVEFDPHAFLYWPASGLVVLPVIMPYVSDPDPDADPDRPASAGPGALVLRLHDGKLDQLGIVRHPGDAGPRGGMIRRSLVVGDTLWTVSDAGARAVSGADLAAQAWVPFT